jgi:hypothetical protein
MTPAGHDLLIWTAITWGALSLGAVVSALILIRRDARRRR